MIESYAQPLHSFQRLPVKQKHRVISSGVARLPGGGAFAELRWWAPFDFKQKKIKTLLHTT